MMNLHFPTRRLRRAALAAALLAFSVHAALAADLVVIVAAKSPVAALRADQVADIFLGQSGRLPDGSEVSAVDQAIGTPQRDEFYQQVANKSPALVKSYWTKMIFTGRAQPPREVAGSAAVRRLVATTPGMIGYVERAALDDSVKVVLVVH